jgi:hypothetical protein
VPLVDVVSVEVGVSGEYDGEVGDSEAVAGFAVGSIMWVARCALLRCCANLVRAFSFAVIPGVGEYEGEVAEEVTGVMSGESCSSSLQ